MVDIEQQVKKSKPPLKLPTIKIKRQIEKDMVAKNRGGAGQSLTNNRVRNAAVLNSGSK